MDKYYQLLERETTNVSAAWKVCHLICSFTAAVCSFVCFCCFGSALEAFNDNCYIFSKIKLTPSLERINSSSKGWFLNDSIDTYSTEWGADQICDFCEFTPAVSMIVSTILGVFFLIYSKGGAGYVADTVVQPWRIVYPSLFISTVMFIVTLVAAIEYQLGLDTFCAYFKTTLGSSVCSNKIDYYTMAFFSQGRVFYVYAILTSVFHFLTVLAWFGLTISLIARVLCIADFQLIRVTVKFPRESDEALNFFDSDFFYVYESFGKDKTGENIVLKPTQSEKNQHKPSLPTFVTISSDEAFLGPSGSNYKLEDLMPISNYTDSDYNLTGKDLNTAKTNPDEVEKKD